MTAPMYIFGAIIQNAPPFNLSCANAHIGWFANYEITPPLKRGEELHANKETICAKKNYSSVCDYCMEGGRVFSSQKVGGSGGGGL